MTYSQLKKNAVDIVRRLQKAGFEAYIVGGAVRDMVLECKPKDYDIATNASPPDIKRLFRKVYPVGAQFGVSMVVKGSHAYEVAQFRVEGVYEDGRRPLHVQPAQAIEDVLRRDFTMNALLYDPIHDTIIDHVHGVDDIHARIIRTVGDPHIRFMEDHLRMLRAVRFSARFNCTIEQHTFEAIRSYAQKITLISAERIGDEFSKMFTGPFPAKALTLLDKTGFLEILLPEVSAMKGVEQPEEYHPEGDVFDHTLRMLELSNSDSLTLSLGILFHDIGKPVTRTITDRVRFNRHDEVGADIAVNILRRFRFSNDIITRVHTLVRNHMRFIHVKEMRRSTLRRFMAMDGFDEMLELFRLDVLASHGSLELYEFIKQEYNEEHIEGKGPTLPKPLITGHDLIALGFTQGPIFSTILKRVQDAQLENEVTTYHDAIAYVLKLFNPGEPQQIQKRKNNPQD